MFCHVIVPPLRTRRCVCTPQYEYLWADGLKVKKPVRLAAPEYINALFDWIEAQVRPRCSASSGTPLRPQSRAMQHPHVHVARVHLSAAASSCSLLCIHTQSMFARQQMGSQNEEAHQVMSFYHQVAQLLHANQSVLGAHVRVRC